MKFSKQNGFVKEQLPFFARSQSSPFRCRCANALALHRRNGACRIDGCAIEFRIEIKPFVLIRTIPGITLYTCSRPNALLMFAMASLWPKLSTGAARLQATNVAARIKRASSCSFAVGCVCALVASEALIERIRSAVPLTGTVATRQWTCVCVYGV